MRDANIGYEADRWRQEHRELADESDGNALWSAVLMIGCMALSIGLVSGVVWWFA